MSSSDTPPADAVLDVYRIGQLGIGKHDELMRIVEAAPVKLYVMHRGSLTWDIAVYSTFAVTSDALSGWPSRVAYQFFVSPEHETFEVFDGFECIESLPQAGHDLVKNLYTFNLVKTFVVSLARSGAAQGT